MIYSKTLTTRTFLLCLIVSILIFFGFKCVGNHQDNNAKIIWSNYDNGNQKIVYQYLSLIGDDTSDYFYEYYYENGEIKIKGLENSGIRKGEWIYYFQDGTVQAKINFTNDTANGLFTVYYQNGTVKYKGQFKNNLIDGIWQINDSNKIEKIEFLKGKIKDSESNLIKIDTLEINLYRNKDSANWTDSLHSTLEKVGKDFEDHKTRQ